MPPAGSAVSGWSAGLALLVIAVLTGRMLLLASVHESHPERLIAQDSAAYERLALSILRDGRYTAEVGGEMQPDVIRTPGYPAYVASVYALFGLDRFWPLAIQVALSALALVPLYWMGAMIWSPATGFVAAVLYALDYISLLASQMLLTDSLYVFTLLSALSLGVAALLKERGIQWLLLGFGILLAAATLIRPVSYYLIAPVLAGFVIVFASRCGLKRAAFLGFLVLLPWVLIVGGWQARNYVVAQTTELSAIKGINLMRYRGAYIIARRDGIPLLEARKVFRSEIPGLDNMSGSEKSDAYTRKAVELIKTYPGYAAAGQLRGTAQLLLVPGEAEVLRFAGLDSPDPGAAGDLLRLPGDAFVHKWVLQHPGFLVAFTLAFLYLVVLYAGSGLSMVRLFKEKGPHTSAQLLLVGVALYLVLVAGGPEGYPRLRMPVTPLAALFAAAGWLWLRQRKHDGNTAYAG